MKWEDFFNQIKNKKYYIDLINFIDEEYKNYKCYPKKEDIFKAFEVTKLDNLKVIIFGQDPYFNEGEANGLAFSVNKGIKLPPSLKNIFKEINYEFNNPNKEIDNGNLTYLGEQGVLLLNTYLTVRDKSPLSHKNELYDEFIKDFLSFVSNLDVPLVFMLWGNHSKKLKKYISNPKHLIIENSHPSPLGANKGGWFYQNQFIKCNDYLILNNIKPIRWLKNN